MEEQDKKNIELLATMVLDLNFSDLLFSNKTKLIDSSLEKRYGISLDNFYNLVWDLLDYTPILFNERRKSYDHVFGAMTDSKNPVFLAIVNKKCK